MRLMSESRQVLVMRRKRAGSFWPQLRHQIGRVINCHGTVKGSEHENIHWPVSQWQWFDDDDDPYPLLRTWPQIEKDVTNNNTFWENQQWCRARKHGLCSLSWIAFIKPESRIIQEFRDLLTVDTNEIPSFCSPVQT